MYDSDSVLRMPTVSISRAGFGLIQYINQFTCAPKKGPTEEPLNVYFCGMKPKSSDLCPVCHSQSLEKTKSPDAQADISWIRCDICLQWYHSLCVELTEFRLKQIALFHCPECEIENGPSHMKRQLKRARAKIDYVALDQGETFAVDKSVHPHVPNFLNFEPSVELSRQSQSFVSILDSNELDKNYVFATGLVKPVLVHNVTSTSGLKLPRPRESITVDYVADKTGGDEQVEVMDVLSQQSELPTWTLRQWKDYFYTPESERDRIRNVISLEISRVEELGTNFSRPKMVADLDLVDKVWCDSDGHNQERPRVTVYCLMSVRGSYTDFHIDFSGTPVYYTVCHGAKTFLMYPPTPENLELYVSWCLEPHQNFTWFADYSKRIKGKTIKPTGGFKVDLKQGDLFIIPSGWIHSVYTPHDAVIIGGNYLTLRDLNMHLKIYDIERRTRVPSKYRFPMFNKVLWLTSWYYFNHQDKFLEDLGIPCRKIEKHHTNMPKLDSQTTENTTFNLEVHIKPEGVSENLDNASYSIAQNCESNFLKDESPYRPEALGSHSTDRYCSGSTYDISHARSVLQSLILHLKQHYEVSKAQPIAKKSIPTRLIGRNVNDYFAKLESWLDTLR
ncbi:Clavaminate synthase-like protein [Metschnikowia bicuspidata var. bicuspidata NRRL YB-4993]|uniref:JmjC domain-containing histone demethylation protein 1 n=1 Tax=Metschnikowia bicuspidata var. bicuspidata NRRL YB-4993 TaxID=869754 RepID=A0A1A0H5S6_9ASCO|nr:Clavaminate synthase-like protein [Metschnikowia bicuspidata var. bicuspidata NRRL YB-4993]OBA19268.1 Clavaminate synthase-like protein [Metschnikowia bicuspidata var. bicuspidata NRRL YB-4993]